MSRIDGSDHTTEQTSLQSQQSQTEERDTNKHNEERHNGLRRLVKQLTRQWRPSEEEAGEHVKALISMIKEDNVLYRKQDLLRVGFGIDDKASDQENVTANLPLAIIYPQCTQDVQHVLRYLDKHRLAYHFYETGALTSGRADVTPSGGEVLVSLAKMDRLLKIDDENEAVVVQPGFNLLDLPQGISVNTPQDVPNAWRERGSQVFRPKGNSEHRAENETERGGLYHSIIGAEVVRPNGEVLTIGGVLDPPGYDLLGVIIELDVSDHRKMGVITSLTLRMKKVRSPKTISSSKVTCIEDFQV
ncbi:FAD-binding oxidoreductase [Caldalkalibacillus salinus]|uniref:FAD-binding oxidoreductase n=1 Tax=Caldalkalibacillus salinus TaxID=2803787 RepID=UPI001923C30C|nr:FAD-binding protein [Caldalkalibacillus salinus]